MNVLFHVLINHLKYVCQQRKAVTEMQYLIYDLNYHLILFLQILYSCFLIV